MKEKLSIIKRSGEEVSFDKSKIFNAISKANEEVIEKERLTKRQIEIITDTIEETCMCAKHTYTVEEIQDLVETLIMKHHGYKVAQRYIRYRYEHEL